VELLDSINTNIKRGAKLIS